MRIFTPFADPQISLAVLRTSGLLSVRRAMHVAGRAFGLLAVFALSLCALDCNAQALAGDSTPADAFVKGADISALPVFEHNGTIYRNAAGKNGDAVKILRDAGLNGFRIRLFVNPTEGGIVVNNLNYTLALGRRIKASGAKLMLDIHYSDTWADPSKQFKPKAWETLDFDTLAARVENYTKSVIALFILNDAAPDYVQLGNEITNGMLWPEGKVEFGDKDSNGNSASWTRFAALQKAAHDGLVSGCAGHALPKVILHIESTGNLPRTEWYINEAAAHGIAYDILGFSYYPNWHGTMDDLSKTLTLAASKSGRPVMVVETASPWKTNPWPIDGKPFEYPATREGQKEFTVTLMDTVRAVPDGRGAGVFWWYPEAVLNNRIDVWLSGDCALFDKGGKLLPAALELGK